MSLPAATVSAWSLGRPASTSAMALKLLTQIARAARRRAATPPIGTPGGIASLEAPAKEIVWFEGSAHMPNIEEPEAFQRALIAIGARHRGSAR